MAKPVKRTLGKISDEILVLQREMKGHEDKAEDCKKRIEILKTELQAAADEQKLDKGGGKASSFTIKPLTVPQVANWDLFYEFILKNKYLHLLERRPGKSACTELWEQNKVIPGVEKFTMMKVNVKEA